MWSGGEIVLGKLPVPGSPTFWIVGQGPIAFAVGAGGVVWTFYSPLSFHCITLYPSPWETARYRLKYCLKEPLNQKQPNNQPNNYRTSYCNDSSKVSTVCGRNKCFRRYLKVVICGKYKNLNKITKI